MNGPCARSCALFTLLFFCLVTTAIVGQEYGPVDDFDAVWQAVSESYADPDFDTDSWQALRDDYRSRVRNAEDEEEAYELLSEMLDHLDNEELFVIAPSMVPQLLQPAPGVPEQEYAGIGVMIAEREDGSVVATGTFRDAPAEAAGVLPGDVIVAVDGEPLPAEGATDAAVERIRGPVDSQVTLTLRDPDGELRDVTITRGQIDLRPSVEARMERPGVGYIRIPAFTIEIVQEASRAIPSLMSARGLVLDLRAVSGGAPEAMVIVGRWFLGPAEPGFLVTREERHPLPHLPDAVAAFRQPLVILTDGRTSGVGEVLAEVLREYRRASVIGATTAGRSQVGQFLQLPSGGLFHLVIGRYETPQGRSLGTDGVVPDEEIDPPDLTAIRAGEDPYLDRAEEIIRQGGRL